MMRRMLIALLLMCAMLHPHCKKEAASVHGVNDSTDGAREKVSAGRAGSAHDETDGTTGNGTNRVAKKKKSEDARDSAIAASGRGASNNRNNSSAADEKFSNSEKGGHVKPVDESRHQEKKKSVDQATKSAAVRKGQTDVARERKPVDLLVKPRVDEPEAK